MIRAHELARLLLAGPNVPVCTWQNQAIAAVEACDADIETVVQTGGHRETVIVLGMDMAELKGEVLYSDRPGIVKTTAPAQTKKAQGGS